MSMNYTDLEISNRLLVWNNHSIIITSGRADNNSFIGNCIVSNHRNQVHDYFNDKQNEYIFYNKHLLPPLPSILNFQIYEHELY